MKKRTEFSLKGLSALLAEHGFRVMSGTENRRTGNAVKTERGILYRRSFLQSLDLTIVQELPPEAELDSASENLEN